MYVIVDAIAVCIILVRVVDFARFEIGTDNKVHLSIFNAQGRELGTRISVVQFAPRPRYRGTRSCIFIFFFWNRENLWERSQSPSSLRDIGMRRAEASGKKVSSKKTKITKPFVPREKNPNKTHVTHRVSSKRYFIDRVYTRFGQWKILLFFVSYSLSKIHSVNGSSNTSPHHAHAACILFTSVFFFSTYTRAV